jgi:hypothetical protein
MAHISRTYIRLLAGQFNEEKCFNFQYLGKEGHYTKRQKDYTLELIDELGIRATARILKIPRRTIQRWCRKNFIQVRRCPLWVYDWAERRRKRKEFWARRGYC